MGPVKRGDDPPESGVLGLKPVQGNGVREPEWTLQAVPEDRSAVWRLVFPPCAGRPRPVRDRAVVQVVVEDNVIGLNIGHGVVVPHGSSIRALLRGPEVATDIRSVGGFKPEPLGRYVVPPSHGQKVRSSQRRAI